jgi:hypothetical protein
MFRYLAIFISFFILFNTSAGASGIALVIGNANYQTISPLKNTINDANDMAQVLRELNFEVIKLTNGTKRHMLDAVHDFTQKLQRSGQVGLFYYSGHGVQKDGRNYLIPVKTNIRSAADLKFEAVDAEQVLANIKQAGNKLNIIILDACRNNPFKGLLGFRGAGERGLTRIKLIPSSIVAYATQPGNVAIERARERNGLYTKHLLHYLGFSRDKKNKPPLNSPPGLGLSLPELFNKVGRAVLDDTGGKQEPWVSFSPLPDICLAGGCSGQLQTDDEDGTNRRKVEQLLQICQKHFDADRLTRGKGGTALGCYKEVLTLRPVW